MLIHLLDRKIVSSSDDCCLLSHVFDCMLMQFCSNSFLYGIQEESRSTCGTGFADIKSIKYVCFESSAESQVSSIEFQFKITQTTTHEHNNITQVLQVAKPIRPGIHFII